VANNRVTPVPLVGEGVDEPGVGAWADEPGVGEWVVDPVEQSGPVGSGSPSDDVAATPEPRTATTTGGGDEVEVGSGGDEVEAASDDASPVNGRSGLAPVTLLLGVVGVALIGGLGFAFWSSVTSKGGAESPDAVMEDLAAGLETGDVLSVLDLVDPDELGSASSVMSRLLGGFEAGLSTDADDASGLDLIVQRTDGNDGVEWVLDEDGPREGLRFATLSNAELSIGRSSSPRVPVVVAPDGFLVLSPGRTGVGDLDTEAPGTQLRVGPRADADPDNSEDGEEGGASGRSDGDGEDDDGDGGGDEQAGDEEEPRRDEVAIALVARNGRWYVSPFRSAAETWLRSSGDDIESRPRFGASQVPAGTRGAADPLAAVAQLIEAGLEDYEPSTAVRYLEPGSSAVLSEYLDPLVEATLGENFSPESERDRRAPTLEHDLRLVDQISNTRALVSVDNISGSYTHNDDRFDNQFARLGALGLEGFNNTFEWDGWCLERGAERRCADSELLDIAATSPEFAELRSLLAERPEVVVVSEEGRWFVSPIETLAHHMDHAFDSGVLDDLTSVGLVSAPVVGPGDDVTVEFGGDGPGMVTLVADAGELEAAEVLTVEIQTKTDADISFGSGARRQWTSGRELTVMMAGADETKGPIVVTVGGNPDGVDASQVSMEVNITVPTAVDLIGETGAPEIDDLLERGSQIEEVRDSEGVVREVLTPPLRGPDEEAVEGDKIDPDDEDDEDEAPEEVELALPPSGLQAFSVRGAVGVDTEGAVTQLVPGEPVAVGVDEVSTGPSWADGDRVGTALEPEEDDVVDVRGAEVNSFVVSDSESSRFRVIAGGIGGADRLDCDVDEELFNYTEGRIEGGETHCFRFRASGYAFLYAESNQGRPLDTTLTIYDDEGVEIAFDDDGSGNGGSVIEQNFEPGDYTAAVRLFDDQGAGEYFLTREG